MSVRSRERTLILVVLIVLVILVVERQHGRALPPRVRAGGRDGFCLFGLFREALLSRATLRARGRVVRGFVQRRRLERALPAGERVQSPELVGGDGALAAVRRGVPAGARRGHRGVFDFGFQQRREKRRGASRARAFAPPRRGVRDSDTPAHAAAREDRRRESVACLVGVRAPILAPLFRGSSRERRNTTNGSADVPRCEVLGREIACISTSTSASQPFTCAFCLQPLDTRAYARARLAHRALVRDALTEGTPRPPRRSRAVRARPSAGR